MSKPIKIVRLDGVVCPPPTFNIPQGHTFIEHQTTQPEEIIPRLGDADVLVTTRVPVTAEALAACPSLKMIAVLAIGTDMVDLAACKERGVIVSNIPDASDESVAEHAIALFFAVRRSIVTLHGLLAEGDEWVERGSLTRYFGNSQDPELMVATCREETMGIIGAGSIGNRIANIAKALGMKTIFAERKGVPQEALRGSHVEFTEVLRTSTIIMITCPLSPSTKSLISTAEFALMRPDAILVNVARGGIVVEEALVTALKEKRIEGAATDVFLQEPAGGENVLIAAVREGELRGRLVLSPHVAWFARSSMRKLLCTLSDNVEAWARGEPQNLVE